MAPVLMLAVWLRARPRVWAVGGLMAAATLLPLLPFAVWDWAALRYALYGSYGVVIRSYLWQQTTAVQHTLGLTGIWLSHGLSRLVDVSQAIVMLLVYTAAWRAMRRGASALPWLGAALLAFSMTTLWPVTYVYFDVFLVFLSGVVAGTPIVAEAKSVWRPWAIAIAVAAGVVGLTAWVLLPASPDVRVGRPEARPLLRKGFSTDEREGTRTYAWVDGLVAQIELPRRGTSHARVVMELRPALASADLAQDVSVLLNGTPIGATRLTGGWTEVSFDAPAAVWQTGANELQLTCGSRVSPKQLGTGDDTRELSVAVGHVRVVLP